MRINGKQISVFRSGMVRGDNMPKVKLSEIKRFSTIQCSSSDEFRQAMIKLEKLNYEFNDLSTFHQLPLTAGTIMMSHLYRFIEFTGLFGKEIEIYSIGYNPNVGMGAVIPYKDIIWPEPEMFVKRERDINSLMSKECECGAVKSNAPAHFEWCPQYIKPLI